jgi:hypothetical protein
MIEVLILDGQDLVRIGLRTPCWMPGIDGLEATRRSPTPG